MLIPPASNKQNPEFILEAIPSNKDHFLIFMASPSEDRPGRPWCRDCEHAEVRSISIKASSEQDD